MAESVPYRDLHRVVAACLIYRFGDPITYLGLRRQLDSLLYPGRWTLPGGGLERVEYESLPMNAPDGWESPLETTLRREIREEAGVEVGPFSFLNDFAFIRPDEIPVFGARFSAPYLSGQVRINHESTEYAWIAAEDVPQYDFLGNIPAEIARFEERLRGGR